MDQHSTRLRQVASQASKLMFAQGFLTFSVCVGLFAANWDKPDSVPQKLSLIGIGVMAVANLALCWGISRQLRGAVADSMAADTY